MVANGPKLREFIGKSGGANSLLHFGSKTTLIAEAELIFQTPTGRSEYYARWVHAAGDALILAEEQNCVGRKERAVDIGVPQEPHGMKPNFVPSFATEYSSGQPQAIYDSACFFSRGGISQHL